MLRQLLRLTASNVVNPSNSVYLRSPQRTFKVRLIDAIQSTSNYSFSKNIARYAWLAFTPVRFVLSV